MNHRQGIHRDPLRCSLNPLAFLTSSGSSMLHACIAPVAWLCNAWLANKYKHINSGLEYKGTSGKCMRGEAALQINLLV